MKKLFLALSVAILAMSLASCGPATGPQESDQELRPLGSTVTTIGQYVITNFRNGDDECYVAIDEGSTNTDAVSLDCNFGDNQANGQIQIGTVGLYTISYFRSGDDECYVATDDDSSYVDAVSIDCRFGN